MGSYHPHRHINRRPRRVSGHARTPVPATLEDTAARREQIARERERQAQIESERRARLIARRQEREARKAEADRIEAMAYTSTFPWEATEHLVKMIESSGRRFNRGIPYTSRAAFWGARLVFGPAMGMVYASLSGDRLTPKQELLGSVSCPYTLDFKRVKPVIEFLIALARHQKLLVESASYRTAAAECARSMIEHRGKVADRICRGEDLNGQEIEELTQGWFKFRGRISNPPPGPLSADAVFYDGKHLTFIPASASDARVEQRHPLAFGGSRQAAECAVTATRLGRLVAIPLSRRG